MSIKLSPLGPLSRENSAIDVGKLSRANSGARFEHQSNKLPPLSRGNSSATHIAAFRLSKSNSGLSTKGRLTPAESEASLSPPSSAATHFFPSSLFVHDKRVNGVSSDVLQIVYEGDLVDNPAMAVVIGNHVNHRCFELVFLGKMFLPISRTQSMEAAESLRSPIVEIQRIYLVGSLVESLIKPEDVARLTKEKLEFFKKRHRHFELETLQHLAITQLIKETLHREIPLILSQVLMLEQSGQTGDESVVFTNMIREKPECLIPINIDESSMDSSFDQYLHAHKIHGILLKAVENFRSTQCRNFRPKITPRHTRNLSHSRFLNRQFNPECFLISAARYRWYRVIDIVMHRIFYVTILRMLMQQALQRLAAAETIAAAQRQADAEHCRQLSLRIKYALGEDLMSEFVSEENARRAVVSFHPQPDVVVIPNVASSSYGSPSRRDISQGTSSTTLPAISGATSPSLDHHYELLKRLKEQHPTSATSAMGRSAPVRSSAELRTAAFEMNMVH